MKQKNRCYAALVIALAALAASCRSQEPAPAASLPNPASVYCTGLGFEEQTRTNDAGQYGLCIFPDGSECDTWDFLAGRCGREHSYCAQQGYVLEPQADSNIGTCVFDDGSSCGEYEYFQGECEPGG